MHLPLCIHSANQSLITQNNYGFNENQTIALGFSTRLLSNSSFTKFGLFNCTASAKGHADNLSFMVSTNNFNET